MTITPGDFWVAEIPFTDRRETKKRPVLVLWIDAQDVIVSAVTSAAPRSVNDIALQNWQYSNLRTASTVRLARLDCLEKSLLIARIGHIFKSDAQQIREIWDIHVKPQFS
jgi:mRNA interferase MazF